MTVAKERFSLATRQLLEAALVDYVYQQNSIGLLTSLVCATVLAVVVFPNVEKNTIFIWYAFFVLVTLLRYMAVISYKKNKEKVRITLWRNLFIVGALLGGINWGLSGSMLLVSETTFQLTVQILIIAGITAGAVPLYAGIIVSAILFLVTTLLPLIIYLLFMKMSTFFLLGITISAYLVYLIMLSIKQHNLIRESIGLRYENEGLVRDLLNAKKQLEGINQKLHQAATHDPLTNLANRNLFEESLEQAINRAERQKKILALLYIDLDGFKQINDHYGHAMGDILLLSVVQRLKNNLRAIDITARLGGDEFVAILEDIQRRENVVPIVKNLMQALNEPYMLAQVKVSIGVSIGISFYPLDGYDVESLLRNADNAMYHVKQHGRNNYCFASDVKHD